MTNYRNKDNHFISNIIIIFTYSSHIFTISLAIIRQKAEISKKSVKFLCLGTFLTFNICTNAKIALSLYYKNNTKTKIMQTKKKQQAKLYRLKAKRRKLLRTLASRGLEVNQEYEDLTHDITVLEMNLLSN